MNLLDLSELDLSGVAISAAIDADGALTCVDEEGMRDKVAAIRDSRLVRIHTLVVAADQQGLEGVGDNEHDGIHVVYAETLCQALDHLQADAQTRWRYLLDQSAEFQRHPPLVGREWLLDQMDAAIAKAASGNGPAYVLLTAAAGMGKSAIVAQAVRQRQDAVYHFIRRDMPGWDDPNRIFQSLCAQVCRLRALPLSQDKESQPSKQPAEALLDALQRAAPHLDDAHPLVLWLDGLDEAFGRLGRHQREALPGLLPRMLPPHVVVVLTSRPGEHLDWLGDHSLCHALTLEAGASDNQADIRKYLEEENLRRALDLPAEFVSKLVEASEGCFAAATRYLEDPLRLKAWQADPDSIPRGLDGWLADQWRWMMVQAAKQFHSSFEDLLRLTLGLLATAREPVSWNQLDALLRLEAKMPVGAYSSVDLHRHLRPALRLAEGLFEPRSGVDESAPWRFFHTRFQEYVLERLSTNERQDLDRVLAMGCGNWANLPEDEARRYALAHRLQHLAETQDRKAWRE
ncbi:MAG: ATP-binding protein, partial [Anaerolineaceae bacterium]|nr:ATP-binding protein [Anaerolineaceae bacterium]